jgi:RNA polymerase sigma-70 factor (ECF subfamily)
MDSSEQALNGAVAAAKAGDAGALHYLYVRFADELRGYVANIVGNRDDAEDVVQDVFLKLTRKLRHYETRSVPFAGWLTRVARNAAIDHLRARRQVPVAEVRVDRPVYDAGEGVRALRAALGSLPVDQREVLLLRHVAGLSPGEIATRLQRTESSIHGLHHRGRGALQAALSEAGCAPVTAARAR